MPTFIFDEYKHWPKRINRLTSKAKRKQHVPIKRKRESQYENLNIASLDTPESIYEKLINI